MLVGSTTGASTFLPEGGKRETREILRLTLMESTTSALRLREILGEILMEALGVLPVSSLKTSLSESQPKLLILKESLRVSVFTHSYNKNDVTTILKDLRLPPSILLTKMDNPAI
jgi:hypothetical protein